MDLLPLLSSIVPAAQLCRADIDLGEGVASRSSQYECVSTQRLVIANVLEVGCVFVSFPQLASSPSAPAPAPAPAMALRQRGMSPCVWVCL